MAIAKKGTAVALAIVAILILAAVAPASEASTAIYLTGDSTASVGDSVVLTATLSGSDGTDSVIWGISEGSSLATLVTDGNTATLNCISIGSVIVVAASAEDPTIQAEITITISAASTAYSGNSDGDPIDFESGVETLANLFFDGSASAAGLLILIVIMVLLLVIVSTDIALVVMIPLSMVFYALGFLTSSALILMVIVSILGLTVSHSREITGVLRTGASTVRTSTRSARTRLRRRRDRKKAKSE